MKLFDLTEVSVRLIDQTGKMVGVFSSEEAKVKASNAGYDLIVVNEDDTLPIVKMVDYNKERFRQQKATRAAQAKIRASQVETKEIRLRPVTDQNDLRIKARKVTEFLTDGNNCRVVMTFKGREINNKQVGKSLLNQFLVLVPDHIQDQYNESEKTISVLLKSNQVK